MAEVSVLLSNYQAEYGRMSGANITLVTKSGTQDFHGLASYFKRHEQFNANDFFNNRLGQPKPRYRFNTWNYNVGGPVYIPGKFNRNREKLFFFFSQEYWPLRTSQPLGQLTVPTELERAGDFSQSVDLNNRMIAVNDPTTGKAFPGNRVPASRIDPNGQALLKFLPLPNFFDRSLSAGRYNYVFQTENNTPQRMETLKLDYNIDSRNMLMGNFSDYSDVETGAVGAGTAGAVKWPQFFKKTTHNGFMALIRYTTHPQPLPGQRGEHQLQPPAGGRQLRAERARAQPARQDRLQRAAVQPGQQSAEGRSQRHFRRRHQPGRASHRGPLPALHQHDIFTFTTTSPRPPEPTPSRRAFTWTVSGATRPTRWPSTAPSISGATPTTRSIPATPTANAAYSACSTPTRKPPTAPFMHYRLSNVEWFAQDNWRPRAGSRSISACASPGTRRFSSAITWSPASCPSVTTRRGACN